MIEADLLNYVDHKAADEFENFTPVCTHSFIIYICTLYIYMDLLKLSVFLIPSLAGPVKLPLEG